MREARANPGGATAGREPRSGVPGVALALSLVVTALLMTWAPTAAAAPRPSNDDCHRARLLASRDVAFTSPLARLVDGALVSPHREPDGDDHDIDPNPAPAPSRQFVVVRAAGDAAAAIQLHVERCAVAFAFSSGATSAGSATGPRAAASRAPPLSA
jgi:hypothetical protein